MPISVGEYQSISPFQYSGFVVSGVPPPTILTNLARFRCSQACVFYRSNLGSYFTHAWEQRKLGELADVVRGASPRPIQDVKWFDNDSDVGWLRISDVTEQDGRIKYLAQRISKLGQEKTRVLVEPHLLLSIAATVGKPVVNYVKTGVHDGFLIFLNPKFEQEFMFQWLDAFRENWKKYGQPG